MAKDPVCGMDVDPENAAATSEYAGRTYTFCAPGCKATFDADPETYIGGEHDKHDHGEHAHHEHH